MSERKTIYLCLAHMSEDGVEQKYVKEAFDTNWVVPCDIGHSLTLNLHSAALVDANERTYVFNEQVHNR